MDSVDFPSCWKQEKYVRPVDYTLVDLYGGAGGSLCIPSLDYELSHYVND